MGETRRIPPIEAFIKNGGMFVVLRPIADAFDDERSLISFEHRKRMAAARRAAAAGGRVDLVIIPTGDETAYRTCDPGWPRGVFVELVVPHDEKTPGGHALNLARSKLRNVELQRYLCFAPVRDALTRWAEAASAAIARVLEIRMVHTGRVVICGGEPFVGLLASHLVPKTSRGGCLLQDVLKAPIYREMGFTVSRLGEFGSMQIKPLCLIKPPTRDQASNVLLLQKKT